MWQNKSTTWMDACTPTAQRMEEEELLKERFQAITDKRKLQEEITQRRLKVEEEKLKHQHLKKKALREKWLWDGLSTLTPEEQEELQNQHREDQHQINKLEQNIRRLEKEIEDIEKEELTISAKEKAILKKLKSVERTTEDIIKSVKVERIETTEEPADYIYANIPDLPKPFRPSALKKTGHLQTDDEEENRRALFAMEIKVKKDMKTGESTVLSTIPLPSDEFKGAGVKVYDDGRKSVYAVCANGSIKNDDVNDLAPVEVEDLLRQATEKQSKSPTEYHEPVYANQFCRPRTPQKDKFIQEANGGKDNTQNKISHLDNIPNELVDKDKWHEVEKDDLDTSKSCQQNSHCPVIQQLGRPLQISPQNKLVSSVQRESTQEAVQPYQKMREYQDIKIRNSSLVTPESEDNSNYSVVQAVPCYVDDTEEPVTMIFMGYQHVDDEELNKKICGYDGIIHAELVVISDDSEDEDRKTETPLYHPVGPYSQVYQPSNQTCAVSQTKTFGDNINKPLYKNSMSLKEQEESLSCSTFNGQLDDHLASDGTEEPSLTALRMRMAKLGKKVI
ncbi:palmdelphin isoform X2 [Python bivittatus]|uniref:Palmdelphin n=1 Tax=Python bivittatus TaxID=176946 RepID=A0A9F2KTY8_PYTBI|nr:palmdelphin isoform X2 [Python bivittatus]